MGGGGTSTTDVAHVNVVKTGHTKRKKTELEVIPQSALLRGAGRGKKKRSMTVTLVQFEGDCKKVSEDGRGRSGESYV